MQNEDSCPQPPQHHLSLGTEHPAPQLPLHPAPHAHTKALTAEAGESSTAQPRSHRVLDGATALAIKVKWDLKGLACIQQGAAPSAVPQLLVQVAGWANWIPFVFSGLHGLGGEGQEAWVKGTQREWSWR